VKDFGENHLFELVQDEGFGALRFVANLDLEELLLFDASERQD
jgi:hypothetical protein